MLDYDDPRRPQVVQRVVKEIKDKGIKYCWLEFLSIDGFLKSVGINSNRIEGILETGEGFDGSSIDGYGRLEESDMVAIPDPSTFAIVPWIRGGDKVARFLCDIYRPDESRYEGDGRYILQRQIRRAKKLGFDMQAAPELEFFLLKKENSHDVPQATDIRGYFDGDPGDKDQFLRRKIALYAENFPDTEVETVHHEVARSQHEIDIRYNEVGKIADSCITMRTIVKAVAAQNNYIGTFMPKPWSGHNGSGMHVHMSLWDKDMKKNMFYDTEDPNKISDNLRYWIGGLLKYAKDITAVLNSWPNSYKRLIPGYEAPTYISWGFKNRSMLIRVPNFFDKSKAARCEIRSPDPAGNIYLQMAVLLAAGLEGICNKIDPGEPTEINVFGMTRKERKDMGIRNLPESLGQALHIYRNSDFMKKVLGKPGYDAYYDLKIKENQRYNSQVSEWELKRYAGRL